MTDLAAVRWIGGGSGAGKSTVAAALGERLGIPVVETDRSLPGHAAALAGRPIIDAFTAMSMDERWLLREPDEMLWTFPWFAGEGFDLLVDEVRALPHDGPVLVEGFRLLPSLVAPLLGDAGRAVWLLPTPERRAAVLRSRDADRAFWLRTSDPDRALENVLERDRLFTERARAEAEALRLPSIAVDGTEPVEALVARAARLLALP